MIGPAGLDPKPVGWIRRAAPGPLIAHGAGARRIHQPRAHCQWLEMVDALRLSTLQQHPRPCRVDKARRSGPWNVHGARARRIHQPRAHWQWLEMVDALRLSTLQQHHRSCRVDKARCTGLRIGHGAGARRIHQPRAHWQWLGQDVGSSHGSFVLLDGGCGGCWVCSVCPAAGDATLGCPGDDRSPGVASAAPAPASGGGDATDS